MVEQASASTTERPVSFEQAFLEGVAGAGELWLIRHGAAFPRRVKKTGEGYDPPLTPLGERQAERLALRLRAEGGLDRLYSSPLRRARQTAGAIAFELDLPVIEVFDLREVEWRRGEGAGAPLSPEVLDDARVAFQRGGRWDVFPFSESSASLRGRVRRALDGICAANPGRRLGVVCHGGVINAYLADLYGTERDMLFLPRNTSINSLRVLGEAHFVDRLNDAHHLEGIAEGDEEIRPAVAHG